MTAFARGRMDVKRWVALLALPAWALALPLQAQVAVHGAVARDLWDRDEGFEEMYYLAGISWTPGRWQYRVSAAAHVLQSDSSLRLGGEVSSARVFSTACLHGCWSRHHAVSARPDGPGSG